MSAFDTSTNTPSVSFTNSFGTAVLQPSAITQYVYGFNRSTAKRYYEFYVNNAGGGISQDYFLQPLWVGITGAAGIGDIGTSGKLYGSSSRQSDWANDAMVPSSTASNSLGQTISTGDTWMFTVDFGGGTDHTGAVKQATRTDGAGNLMLPVYVDVGKNGSWGTYGIINWIYSAFGFSGKQKPLVARAPTGASAATVSLRVVTTSFFYAIPSGFIAWGDGPEDVTAPSVTYTIGWDPTTVVAGSFISLSSTTSNRIAKWTPHAASLSYYWIYSTPLPAAAASAGRRVVEFTWGDTTSRSSTAWPPKIALIDANAGAGVLTNTASSALAYIFRGGVNGAVFRGTVHPSLSTSGLWFDGGITSEGWCRQLIVDHTNMRMWSTNRTAVATEGAWGGVISAATLASPYKSGGTDGTTITDSVGLRWAAMETSDSTISAVEINVGQRAYITYPLMPGVVSYNGNRQVYGTGDTWQTGLTPSVSYSHSNFGVTSVNPAILHVASSAAKSSGKLFFQVWHGDFNVGASGAMTYTTGLRPATMTTLSAAAHTKNNLVWEIRGSDTLMSRYSVTSTGTFTLGYNSNNNSFWESIAVDFDTGKLWFGWLNHKTRTNVWLSGGDPSAGTGANMTFTASTTLKAFTYLREDITIVPKTTIFVSEANNLVDIPTGFTPWNVTVSTITATPSGAVVSGVLWPYGVQT